MIVGETRTVRHQETGESAFTLDDADLAVTLPDGTSGGTPTVTVTPGTSALVQTLSANVSFPQAGAYTLVWTLDQADQDPIIRIETYFATWTDVYAVIRRLLNRTPAQLPDATIDAELARLVRLLTTDYTCLGVYDDLTGTDRAYFDDALAYMVAASLRGGMSRLNTDGDLIERQEGDTRYKFADRAKADTVSQESLWLSDAWGAFRRIGCIADGLPDVRAALRPSLYGRRRAAEKAGYIVSATNPLLRYLIDEDRRMMGIGVY
jgi:hypothetical protein